MTVLQQIIALIFTPTAIIAVLAFLLRGVFQQLLDHDAKRYELEMGKALENHKAQLTQEYEASKLRLENELQKQFYQYQTKFSAYHQKQVEVVSELYGMIVDTRDKVTDLVTPPEIQHGTRTNAERYSDTATTFNSLSIFYRRNRFYVNENSCQKADKILEIMQTSILKHKNLYDKPSQEEEWLTAYRDMHVKVEPLLNDLEKQLRQSLSEIVEVRNASLD